MKKHFHRFVSLALIGMLLLEPGAAACAGIQGGTSLSGSRPPVYQLARFEEEAFAARLLSARRFLYALPTSFWKSLTTWSAENTDINGPGVASIPMYFSRLTGRQRRQGRTIGLGTGLLVAAALAYHGVKAPVAWIPMGVSLLAGLLLSRFAAPRAAETIHERGHLRAAGDLGYAREAVVAERDGDWVVVRRSDDEPIVDQHISAGGRSASSDFALAAAGLSFLIPTVQYLLGSWEHKSGHYALVWGLFGALESFLLSATAASVRFAFADQPVLLDKNGSQDPKLPPTVRVAEVISQLSDPDRERLAREGRRWMEEHYYTYLEPAFEPEILKLLNLPEDDVYIVFALAIEDNMRGLKKLQSPFLQCLDIFKTWHRTQFIQLTVSDPIDMGDSFKITIRTSASQPGNLERISELILQAGGNIKKGLRTTPQKQGSTTDLIISKESIKKDPDSGKPIPLNIDALIESLSALKIRRGEHRLIKDVRRMALHLFLPDLHGSFNALLKSLTSLNIRLESVTFDQMPEDAVEWNDLILRVPHYIKDEQLNHALKNLKLDRKRLLGDPSRWELSNADMSEATAQEILRIVEHKLRALGEEVDETLLPGALTGDVDPAVLSALEKAIAIAFDYHGNTDPDHPDRPRIAARQTRKSRGEPFVTHPLFVLHDAITHYRTRNPITLLSAVIHDVLEDSPKYVALLIEQVLLSDPNAKSFSATVSKLKTAHPTMSKLLDKAVSELRDLEESQKKKVYTSTYQDAFKKLASAEIRARITKDFPAYPHKLLQTTESVTEKPGYIEVLTQKGFADLTSMKMADRGVNLLTIFQVSEYFAEQQLAKTIRDFLPLIMQDTAKTEGYVSGRQHFLQIFIRRCSELTVNAEGEDGWTHLFERLKNVPGLPDKIFTFNRWIENNPDYVPPTSVDAEALFEFRLRLDTLAHWIIFHQQNPSTIKSPTGSNGGILNGHANLGTTRIWKRLKGRFQTFQRVFLERLLKQKEARHQFMARVLKMPILKSSIDYQNQTGFVQVIPRGTGRSIMFLLADPIVDLVISAALSTLLITGFSLLSNHPLSQVLWAFLSMPMLPLIYLFFAAGTWGSMEDWFNAHQLLFRPSPSSDVLQGNSNLRDNVTASLDMALNEPPTRREFLNRVYASAQKNGMAVVLGHSSVGKSSLFNDEIGFQFYGTEKTRFVLISGVEGSWNRLADDLPMIIMNKLKHHTKPDNPHPYVWERLIKELGDRVLVFDETLFFMDSGYEHAIIELLEQYHIPFILLNPAASELEQEILSYQTWKETHFEIFHLKPFNRDDSEEAIREIARHHSGLAQLIIDTPGIQRVHDLTGGSPALITKTLSFVSGELQMNKDRTLSALLLDKTRLNFKDEIEGLLGWLQPAELNVLLRFLHPTELSQVYSWSSAEQFIVAFLGRYGYLRRVGNSIHVNGLVQSDMLASISGRTITGHSNLFLLHQGPWQVILNLSNALMSFFEHLYLNSNRSNLMLRSA